MLIMLVVQLVRLRLLILGVIISNNCITPLMTVELEINSTVE